MTFRIPCLHILGGVLALAVAGCSSYPQDPFLGTWQCSGEATNDYTQPAVSTQMVGTMSTVAVSDDGRGNVTQIRTTSTGTTCTYHSRLSSDGATLTAVTPESCTSGSVTTTVTGGTSVMDPSDAYFTSTSAYTLSGTNAMGQMVQGSGSASGTCSRM